MLQQKSRLLLKAVFMGFLRQINLDLYYVRVEFEHVDDRICSLEQNLSYV